MGDGDTGAACAWIGCFHFRTSGLMMKRFFLLTIVWLGLAAVAHAGPWPAQCIQPIALGQTVSGTLAASDCTIAYGSDNYYTDVYSFNGTKGQQIAITMRSTQIDSYLELHPANEMDENAL